MKNIKKAKLNYQEIIYLLYIIYFTIMYAIPQISNLLGKYSAIVNLIVTVFLFLLNIKEISAKKVFLVVLAIFNLLIGMLINDTGLGSLVTIINLYLLFLYSDKSKIRKDCIKISCFIVVVGEIIFFFVNKSVYNPNTIGYLYFVMSVFFYILISEKEKNKGIQLFKIVFTITNIVLIYKSESRASILGFLTFLIFAYMPFIIKNRKVYKVLTFIIVLGGIIFPYIYVSMWNNGIKVEMEYSDKNFYSGRQVKWSLMIEDFKGKELYGLGSNYRFPGSTNLNVHNSLFAIYMIYGIINFVIFLPMLISFIWKMRRNDSNEINRIATAGIIGMIVVSYYESNLIWGNMFMYVVALSIIAMTKFEGDEKNNVQNNGIHTDLQ